MFVDSVRIKLQAGNGGAGAISFRHEKFVDRGGPDGGDGGKGGNIVLVASRNQNTLAAFRYKKQLRAESGVPGSKARKHGRNGSDLEVAVPVGTVVISADGEVLADLASDGQREIIAKGGMGGYGNAHFVSSTRQAPRLAEKGESGQEIDATLELKMIADVGIVGLPNAGKSTFLSVVSNARPEIANYPFTTLTPNLGMVDIDKNSLLFADIPGLIAGASQGKGLGDEFLRHVERTSILLHLIDAYNEDIGDAYRTIIKELHDYKVDLSKKPQVVALTKIEGLPAQEVDAKIKILKKLAPKNTKVTAISSLSRSGVEELLRELTLRVAKASVKQKAKLSQRLPVIGLRSHTDDWQLKKEGERFILTGRKIERFASRLDLNDYQGEQRLRDIMRKMGIMRELARQHAAPGQKIVVGKPSIGSIEY